MKRAGYTHKSKKGFSHRPAQRDVYKTVDRTCPTANNSLFIMKFQSTAVLKTSLLNLSQKNVSSPL